MSEVKTERKSKQFWAIDDFWNVERVTGFECPPNDKVWWVPELGNSLTEGHHLFDTFAEARERGLKNLSSAIHDLKMAYNRLVDAKEPQ